jgi:hypothetical protein
VQFDGEGWEPLQSLIRRSVAQPGSASDLGSEGRRFESYRSDQDQQGFRGFVVCVSTAKSTRRLLSPTSIYYGSLRRTSATGTFLSLM